VLASSWGACSSAIYISILCSLLHFQGRHSRFPGTTELSEHTSLSRLSITKLCIRYIVAYSSYNFSIFINNSPFPPFTFFLFFRSMPLMRRPFQSAMSKKLVSFHFSLPSQNTYICPNNILPFFLSPSLPAVLYEADLRTSFGIGQEVT
jgi:hypothetical protein